VQSRRETETSDVQWTIWRYFPENRNLKYIIFFTGFRISFLLAIDVNSVLGLLYCVDVASVAYIFRVELSKMYE
jgi:hypothetical protein